MPKKENPFKSTHFRKEEIRDARNWFRERVNSLSKKSIKGTNMSDLRYRGDVPLPGRMVYYAYKAKNEDTLPYYDKFPLIIVVDENNKYIQGLNLHYLPPKLRHSLMARLMDTVNNNKFDKTTKFNLTYNILKAAAKYRFFKPCLKLYLKSHIKSKIMIIRPQQWHKAVLLPTANFKGAGQATVWADSKAKF